MIKLSIIHLIFLSSCESDKFSSTQIWHLKALNQLQSKEHLSFHSDVMVFRRNGSCNLPKLDFGTEFSCGCSYILSKDTISISSCSSVFNDKFAISKKGENYMLSNNKYQILAIDSDQMFNKHYNN